MNIDLRNVNDKRGASEFSIGLYNFNTLDKDRTLMNIYIFKPCYVSCGGKKWRNIQ